LLVNTTRDLDGPEPFPVIRPDSVAALGEVVRSTGERQQALYPVGGRTLFEVGYPGERAGVEVDLRSLDQVLDYPARDMTITVQAGITLARLQEILAVENQRLPVEVPRADQATLGGALAVNVSGPRRLGAGTFRDYVIGISTVNDQGQETKAGGRVVKNVAGYDLCKLHIGALGTLGIITQVTLKVRPRPETQALVTFPCDSATLPQLLDLLHASRTRPGGIEVLNRPAARALAPLIRPTEAEWTVVAGYEDSEDAVSWQMQQLIRELGAIGVPGGQARAADSATPLWQALTELTAPPNTLLSFRANLLPSAVAGFCQTAGSTPGILVQAHAGSGIVRGHFTNPDLTEQAAASILKELRSLAVVAQGNLILPHCPLPWKRSLPVWGDPPANLWLMRRVKEQLDPGRLFNPGRFLPGI
jgi:glycolate oxidase FAD binding subunit